MASLLFRTPSSQSPQRLYQNIAADLYDIRHAIRKLSHVSVKRKLTAEFLTVQRSVAKVRKLTQPSLRRLSGLRCRSPAQSPLKPVRKYRHSPQLYRRHSTRASRRVAT